MKWKYHGNVCQSAAADNTASTTTTAGATATTTPAYEKHVSHLTYNIINLEDAAYSFRC
jgi:hypothetical protein